MLKVNDYELVYDSIYTKNRRKLLMKIDGDYQKAVNQSKNLELSGFENMKVYTVSEGRKKFIDFCKSWRY